MAAHEQSVTWRLSDPGMDLLERAGLAALHMTLRAAEESGVDLDPLRQNPGDSTSNSVTVRWTGEAKAAFVKLMEWAWQVRDGVLFLPGVHGEREASQVHLRVASHNGIMRTFLQHTNVQPKGEPIIRVVKLDEDREISISYQPPIIRPSKSAAATGPRKGTIKAAKTKLLKAHKDITELFDRHGQFKACPIELSNWVYPGVAGRYASEGAWEGPPERALLLMLAPTICLYQRLQGSGGNWIIVVPDVRDLDDFAATRRRMNLDADFVDVASLGDAGLQFLAEFATRHPRRLLSTGCRVVAMGKVRYYASQSIRKGVADVAPDLLQIRRYRLLQRELPNAYVPIRIEERAGNSIAKPMKGSTRTRKKSETRDGSTKKQAPPSAAGFIKLPAARGRIADNLVCDRPWYADLFTPLVWDLDELERQRARGRGMSMERLWFNAICYQRSKLMRLIQEDDMWDSEAERVFVNAFWEALDSLYAQEAKAVDRGGSRTAVDRFGDLTEDIRRRLMQAKTRILLRAALAELLAKAGRQMHVRSHPAAIWRLMDHAAHWRQGRDLALLALASHRKRDARQAAEMTTSDSQSTEGE